MLSRLVAMMGAATAAPYVALDAAGTWNPSDKGSGVTLTSADHRADWTNYTNSNVRATTGKQTGRWKWELQVLAVNGSSYINTGVWPGSRSITTYINGTTGIVRIPNASVAVYDIFTCYWDADAGLFTMYKNGTLFGSTSVTVSEAWYPVVGEDNSGGAATIAANFGHAGFTYSPLG